jgi:hypothetical protein
VSIRFIPKQGVANATLWSAAVYRLLVSSLGGVVGWITTSC